MRMKISGHQQVGVTIIFSGGENQEGDGNAKYKHPTQRDIHPQRCEESFYLSHTLKKSLCFMFFKWEIFLIGNYKINDT